MHGKAGKCIGQGALWRAFALAVLVVACSACSALRKDYVKEPSQAQPPDWDTPSTRYVRRELDQHGDLSGFRLLTRNTNALMSRIALVDHAEHTIDLQYYIFEDDDTGRLLAQRLLAAADRGVRVRMLLDDITIDDDRHVFDALDAHPNIQVRLFNPFKTSHPSLPSKIAQFVIEGQRLNRRMHNKSFVVDNAVAIIGGRNIGDAYFDASREVNFSDLDVISIGPVVREASHVFDEYWNSDAAYPVKAFRDRTITAQALAKLRVRLQQHARAFAQSDYAQAVIEEMPNGPTADRRGEWFWGSGELVADQPEKIELREDHPSFRIGPEVRTIMDAAQRELLLVSPYFIPGDSGVDYLGGIAARGVDVAALTNSLASTDETAAYAAYSRYRHDLLAGGVRLFELRPVPGKPQPATSFGKSSGLALHAKAIVVDRRYVFVGSMNIDQRSKLLNTEMGVIVDCPQLADAVADFFIAATSPAASYRLRLSGQDGRHGRVEWVASDGEAQVILHHAPETSLRRRMAASLWKLLPIEGLL